MFDFRILSGALLGWGLGANDSANVFGTAVSSRMVKYRHAIILSAVLIMAGAILQGHHGMHTISGLSTQDMQTAFVSSLAAGITVLVMTVLKLPISTSQAVVGGILGVGLATGADVDFSSLKTIVICWLATPVGAFLFTLVFYGLFLMLFRFITPYYC